MVWRGQKEWEQMRLPHQMGALMHWPADWESQPKSCSILWIVLSVLPIFLRIKHWNQYTNSSMVILVSKKYVELILCRLLSPGQLVLIASMFFGNLVHLTRPVSKWKTESNQKNLIMFFSKLTKSCIIVIPPHTLYFTSNWINTRKDVLSNIWT